ncbi:MAG: SagB/ThcOx family dehydrogenase [Promethearchaeota archaeon]
MFYAIFERTTQRYGERGFRYVFIEVGHCAQNIHLEAVSLGLSSVPIGAFDDNKVKDVLNLKKKIEPLYIIPIGYLS